MGNSAIPHKALDKLLLGVQCLSWPQTAEPGALEMTGGRCVHHREEGQGGVWVIVCGCGERWFPGGLDARPPLRTVL